MRFIYTFLVVLFCCYSFHSPALSSEWQVVVGGESEGKTGTTVVGTDGVASHSKENGIGLVVVSVPERGPIPIGTAWLCKPGVLATNAHVAEGIVKLLQMLSEQGVKGSIPYYLPNRSKGKAVEIVDIAMHPEYKKVGINVHGDRPVNMPDVALMSLKEKLSPPLPIASKTVLEHLKPGDGVQYIGFPMENLAGDNINLHDVMATTQSGTITAISNWWLGDSGPLENQLIRHDMGATGGASGSPILNAAGQVIGLVNAGNVIPNIRLNQNGTAEVQRAPSAAMVNFGIRVDLLEDVNF